MKIFRKAAVEYGNWDNRDEFLVMDAPRAEAIAWMDSLPEADRLELIPMTNEQISRYGESHAVKQLPPMHVQVMPSRDFIVVYHGSTDGPIKKEFPNEPGKLEFVLDWYKSRGITAFVH